MLAHHIHAAMEQVVVVLDFENRVAISLGKVTTIGAVPLPAAGQALGAFHARLSAAAATTAAFHTLFALAATTAFPALL
jgi:hypothetical protein